ncbi:hypothetical protein Dimus_014474 [Dionaea muscipula]
MRRLRALFALFFLHFVEASSISTQRSPSRNSPWLTLDGSAPLVVARGGFSGLFPDSSEYAYATALQFSVSNVILWCDVQLTKDEYGVCFPGLTLDNNSDITQAPNLKQNTYNVDGAPVSGHFFIDATLNELANVTLIRTTLARTPRFDDMLPLLTVQFVFDQYKPPGFWLNIEHAAFYSQHSLNMRTFLLGVSKSVIISHISSPEVKFLQDITKPFAATKIKFIFRFLGKDVIEPSTNQSYGSLLTNLTFINTFASGILVPKNYIWPVDDSLYLQPHTSIVTDAHKVGLQVFAADFNNDDTFAYNYSYNPVAEYLSFIDNGNFSVDGVLSDFPITPSEAIDCFAHIGTNASGQASPLVISHNGASGDYPGCTDIAYKNAISDGANVIDCNVQMSKDGVPFCLSSIDLVGSTTVLETAYSNLTTKISQLQDSLGLFSFSLAWSEIEGLTPQISTPLPEYLLLRNPKFKNAGKLVSLSEFLALAQNVTSLSGVLISIENAFYLAEKQGLSVTDAVLSALDKEGYNDNRTVKKVLIQSTDSSVLAKFKGRNYELVYSVNEKISGILNSTVEDIKTFAHSALITKGSVYPIDAAFTTGVTNIVPVLQSFGFQVYVQLFRNEFVTQAWDFFSDPIVEINEFSVGAGVNGIVTDFPQTAALYKKSRCLTSKDPPDFTGPLRPGNVFQLLNPVLLPPAEAPAPELTVADVSEPALGPAVEILSPVGPLNTPAAASHKSPSSSHCHCHCHSLGNPHILLSSVAMVAAGLLLF